MRQGYQENFIGNDINISIPTFAPELDGTIFKESSLRKICYLDYINYSLAINKTTRQVAVAASNIDQKKYKKVKREANKDWDVDTRIPHDMQLDNTFYKNNPWDRGHIVQRKNNCQGNTYDEAKKAGDDTFYYPNASFQHENYNQNEWVALEDKIGEWVEDANDKLTVFTGPIHLEHDRYYSRKWHSTVRIPSAFFKIVCYLSHQNTLEVRAFIIFQDDETLQNKKG